MCDFYVANKTTGYVRVVDVVITTPNPDLQKHWESGVAETEAGDQKVVAYSSWSIDPSDIIPFALTSYGEWDSRTFRFGRDIALAIAGEDKKVAGLIFARLRQQVAFSLHLGQGRLVAEFNRRLCLADCGRGK